jgi:hypothetical protein
VKNGFLTLVLALSAYTPFAAFAQGLSLPTTVGIHLGTKHSASGFNNTNPGVYAHWSNGATVGVYYNSERATSFYAGYLWQTAPITSLEIKGGLMVGAVTGYQAYKLTPLLVPSLSASIPASQWRARLTYVPKFEKGGAHAGHLSIERSF